MSVEVFVIASNLRSHIISLARPLVEHHYELRNKNPPETKDQRKARVQRLLAGFAFAATDDMLVRTHSHLQLAVVDRGRAHAGQGLRRALHPSRRHHSRLLHLVAARVQPRRHPEVHRRLQALAICYDRPVRRCGQCRDVQRCAADAPPRQISHCLSEWSTGSWQKASFNERQHATTYRNFVEALKKVTFGETEARFTRKRDGWYREAWCVLGSRACPRSCPRQVRHGAVRNNRRRSVPRFHYRAQPCRSAG